MTTVDAVSVTVGTEETVTVEVWLIVGVTSTLTVLVPQAVVVGSVKGRVVVVVVVEVVMEVVVTVPATVVIVVVVNVVVSGGPRFRPRLR